MVGVGRWHFKYWLKACNGLYCTTTLIYDDVDEDVGVREENRDVMNIVESEKRSMISTWNAIFD